MKNLKKLLAFILVAASLFSLPLTASAAESQFYDANEITHKTAVDLLVGVGVINGYEDGSFNPTGEVTRAEMAKMLALVLNGGVDVAESYVSACTFADSQNHWAKGYIGFCVSEGLINGKSATTFDPDGEVTGYEICKMLLCALGYKADLNGLTGKNWNTTAHSLAVKNDLLDYLQEYVPNEPMNRDGTCRMILNALQANMVKTTGNILNVSGVTIARDVDNIPLLQDGSDYAGRAYEATVDGENVSYKQLVEDVMPSLKLLSGTTNDPYGRPCTEWRFKGRSLGVTVMKPVATSSTTLKPSNVLKTLGDVNIRSAEVFVNGESYGTVTLDQLTAVTELSISQIKSQAYARTAGAIATGCGTSIDSTHAATGVKNFSAAVLAQMLAGHSGNFPYANSKTGLSSGSSRATYTFYSEAFYDAGTGKFTLINNNFFYGRVKTVRNAILDEDENVITPGYILVEPIEGDGASRYNMLAPYADLELDENTIISGGSILPISMDDVVFTEDKDYLAVGDYVIFNLGCVDRTATVKTYCGENVRPMERVTVTAEKIVGDLDDDGEPEGYDTVYGTDGVKYQPATRTGSQMSHHAGSTYDLIVAKLGSRSYYFRTEEVAGNYLYLDRAVKNTNALPAAYEARLVKPNGSVEIVQTDRDYVSIVGSIVSATTNAEGQTVLSVPAESDFSSPSNLPITVKNSNSTITFNNITKTADSTTRFIISQIDNGVETYTTYTGIHKVPNIKGSQFYAYVANPTTGVLDTVYILNANIDSTSGLEGVLVKTGKDVSRIDEAGTYYEVQAIVGEQPTTLKVTPELYATMDSGFNIFTNYTVNAKGLISAWTKVSGTAFSSLTPAEAGNITFDSTVFTYHENVLVYTYSVSKNALTLSDVDSLVTLNNAYPSYYTRHKPELYPTQPLAAIFVVID